MLKIGMIGVGGISPAHRKPYQQLLREGLAEIVASCDLKEDRRANETCRHYTDLDTFFAQEAGNLDAVDICLPSYYHAPVAIRAMEAGLHVLVEKPMALNYADALAMCEAAKRTGKTLMVAQCLRFAPEIDVVREIIASGEFGALKAADVRRDFGCLSTESWAWSQYGEKAGGALFDVHIHDVDWMQSVFGIPQSLSSGGKQVFPHSDLDIVSSQYYYENGFFAHVSGEWTTNHNNYACVQQMVRFEHGYFLHTSFDGIKVFRKVREDGTVTEITPEQPSDMYYREIRYFVDCVAAGVPVTRCLPESTAESIRIAEAERASARANGQSVTL